MSEQFRALQGFRDVLPDEQPYWQYVEMVAQEIAELFGYRRIETPLLEETSLFRRTSGESSDIVSKEMYSFDDRADKEGRSQNLSLRPEGTAGVVRAYLEHGMSRLPQPVKLYYLSEPMFRRDRPQAGRYREHHQFGCEALGENDPVLDAEMIALLYQFYTRLGLKQINVQVNSIGDPEGRPQYIEKLREYYRPLLDTCCADCKVRFEKNPLRLLDCKEPQDQAKIANAPKTIDHLSESAQQHFAALRRYLEAYGVPYEINPLLVRGLDYYSHTVFEFISEFDSKLSINGGGRYDGLAELLGGAHVPGIGFGAGIERTILEMKRQGIEPPAEKKAQVFVVYFDRTEELKDAAVHVTARLRKAGLRTEMSYGDRSRKAQMKQANNSQAEYAILIIADELANGVITIKDMRAEGEDIDSKQTQVRLDELEAYFQQREHATV
ncbi:histidine--tRNA ligase [Ktedonobacter racemifer]|uniref:Histidine--tRNA ligase n=1 Tax=Ktedonobacter racemifer DSM 44963 TaxID=485913 RepID=D6TF21_KTERA|nr:histidine--tRNA ligase [Ktedonobacter racemifer]EFH90421.1 histidyl-tRNA synthetase [Ktedonobacter racemifer DSM 44963]